MKITYLGHSCLQIEVCGSSLLVDPFISPNPLAAAIDVTSLMPDFILITHGHADHLADAETIAKNSGATLISNYEIAEWFGLKGVENRIPMNHGGTVHLPFGSVKYVTAIHSSTLPDGTSGGNPGGFVLTTKAGNCYLSGDTALTYDMKLIGESVSLNWAALCVGDHFTMGYQDAVIAAQFIDCDTIVGIHFDTFPPIAIDHAAAQAAFVAAGKSLKLPTVGETWEY